MLDHDKRLINLCKCLQFGIKNLKFDPYKIIKIPDACALKITFPISVCVFFKFLPPSLQNITENIHL